jgi:hypothetical protein
MCPCPQENFSFPQHVDKDGSHLLFIQKKHTQQRIHKKAKEKKVSPIIHLFKMNDMMKGDGRKETDNGVRE